MDNLNFKKLEIQPYLKSTDVHSNEAKNIFKFRTNMSDVKVNFSSQHGNLNCSLGCDELESQEHLICCDKNGLNFKNDVNYKDIFSYDIKKLKLIEKRLSSALAAKNKIKEGQI